VDSVLFGLVEPRGFEQQMRPGRSFAIASLDGEKENSGRATIASSSPIRLTFQRPFMLTLKPLQSLPPVPAPGWLIFTVSSDLDGTH
jgi:hypothetical protein